MSPPALLPITDDALLDYCRFLQQNLDRRRSPEDWAASFRQDWGVASPNHGFMLVAEGRIVGGIGAIYSAQPVRGRIEHFCNITSWCVLDEYRGQSLRLAMALIAQKGFHFSDLTPTEVVSKTLQFLKFKPMNERHAVWPNWPWPGRARIVTEPAAIETVLTPEAAQAYRDHRHLPWLHHLALGLPGAFSHVVFITCRLKGIPGALVLATSDPRLFLRHRRALGSHLLLRHGLFYTRIESRLLPKVPWDAIELKGYRQKVYRSETLGEAEIGNLYTELVALEPLP